VLEYQLNIRRERLFKASEQWGIRDFGKSQNFRNSLQIERKRMSKELSRMEKNFCKMRAGRNPIRR